MRVQVGVVETLGYVREAIDWRAYGPVDAMLGGAVGGAVYAPFGALDARLRATGLLAL